MASSRADCVFGEARLISSPRTMLAKIGPGRNSKALRLRSQMLTPTTSLGSRSGVNCTRPKMPWIERASAFARLVLPTPGTSSTRRWPSDSRHSTTRRMASGLPWMARPRLSQIASNQELKPLVPVAAAPDGLLVAVCDWVVATRAPG